MNDFVHGTEAGYRKHYRRGDTRACSACRRAATLATREREARRLADEVELTGGRWVPRGGIVVWEQAS